MSGEYERIPKRFIRNLETERREFVQLNEKTKIIDLDQLGDTVYPDTAHLLFELLQNAEDAGAASARFELSETKLDFKHDGRPFTKEDVKGILSYFKGTKTEQQETIGRFGIGFKSVFACAETPRIFSDTVAFEIVDRIVPRVIPRPASSIRLSNRETVIELPFDGELKTPGEVRKEIRLGLARISATSILHLKNIKSIKWTTEGGDAGWIKRTELADRVVQVDTKSPSGGDRRYFLRFREPYTQGSSMHLDVVFELNEEKGEQGTLRLDSEALGDCFRIVPAGRGSVAVFFPAEKETSNLRFHLHAPFIPELSRASIKDHSDNADLFARLAELAAKSLSTIRDLGLLDREFLGVLPNSHDPLPEAYKPFHEAIVQEMREKPLVPMQDGGHGRATGLLQGLAEFKDFLGVRDIRFLMSGRDYDSYYDTYRRSQCTNRSTQPSSNYQGWAVSTTQRNTAVDRLLTDLKIDAFKVQYLAPPDSKKEKETGKWLATHDVVWHRAYYSSLARVEHECRGTYKRLQELPIVRASSTEYRPAVECRFASGEEVPEGVTIVDPDIYSSGKGAQRARRALEGLGVQEIDDESRAVGILEAHYGERGDRPAWDKHRGHIESFIEFVKSGSVTAGKFGKYSLLLDSEKDWKPPATLYAGNEYAESSAEPYYRSLQRLGYKERNLHQCPVRYELSRRYRSIPGFGEFARRIGVACQFPILETECQSNPEYKYLLSGGGKRWSYYTSIDRDWYVPCLDRILELLKKAQDHNAEREALATAIWTTLCETKEDKLKGLLPAQPQRRSSLRSFAIRLHATELRLGASETVRRRPRLRHTKRSPVGAASRRVRLRSWVGLG